MGVYIGNLKQNYFNMEYDTDKVNEAALALLYLNLFEDRWGARAWKSMPWEAMDRLHEKGLIGARRAKPSR